jgi:hypothetical protein
MDVYSLFEAWRSVRRAYQGGSLGSWLTSFWLVVEMSGIQGATAKERRDLAKEVNYGILFQMTVRGLTMKLVTDTTATKRYIVFSSPVTRPQRNGPPNSRKGVENGPQKFCSTLFL